MIKNDNEKNATADAGKDDEKKKQDSHNEDDKENLGVVTKPKEEQKLMYLLKKGDYSVHVLIEEVKNLAPVEEDFLPSPIVKVTCLGKTKRTQKLDTACTDYVYTEHFYFEKQNLSVEQLDSEKILIEVYDSKNTSKKDYFGIDEIDFAYVYNNKDHSIHNFWIVLANPESDDITKVRGYLKISISVLNETDDRVELVPGASDDPNSMCVIPPQIKMQYRQVRIYILKAEELPDMDSIISVKKVNRECNGFIEAKYLGLTKRTSVKDMVNEVLVWNEVIEIPVNIPVVSQKIALSVWDKDVLSSDIIGSFELNVNDILDNKYQELRYVNIYGAPLNKKGKFTDKMNENAEIGSLWKGRILMKVEHSQTDNPVTRVKSIDDKKFLKEAYNKGKPNLWTYDVHLYDTFYLPTSNKKYGVRISVQEATYVFPPRESEFRNISWNAKTSLQCHTLTLNPHELPDLFLYLIDESNDNICFQRIPSQSFIENEDIIVIKLFPDQSIGKVEEVYKSGLVKIKIKLSNKNISIPIIDIPPVTNNPQILPERVDETEEESDMEAEMQRHREKLAQKATSKQGSSATRGGSSAGHKTYTVVANIHMTRSLISGDGDGTSDPYVLMKLAGKDRSTSVKYNSVNSIWNECLIFDEVKFDINDKSSWPIMFIQIKDKDPLVDDDLAYSYIWLNDSSYAINELRKITPQWMQLFLPVSNKPQGQLLCSFYIIDSDRKDLTSLVSSLDISPDTSLYTVEINVLGLRDLKPCSMIPIKKAFITFDLNSINVTGKEDSNLRIIKTQPKVPGPNPTINTVIKFDVKLPQNEIFLPEMQCGVYDYLLAGVMNQMLGVFIIPVPSIIKQCELQMERDMKITKDKLGYYLLGKHIFNNNDINLSLIGEEVPSGMIKQIKKTENLMTDNRDNDPLIENENPSGMIKSFSDPRDVKLEMHEILDVGNQKEGTETNQNKVDIQKQEGVKKQVQYPKEQFIIFPVYKSYVIPGTKQGSKNYKVFEVEDESKIPNQELFMKVGWNKYASDGKKHYRRYFSKCLEDVTELGLNSPFFKFPLRRGKFVDTKDDTAVFEALRNINNKIIKRYSRTGEPIGQSNKKTDGEIEVVRDLVNDFYDDKHYGDFKGLIRISEKSKMIEYEKMVQSIKEKNDNALLKDFKYLTHFDDLSKKILSKREVIVRVYILDLYDLAKRDILSESDPYVKISLGNQVINEADSFKEDQKSVTWCKCYDLIGELPGNGNLKIEIWDHDPIFQDELIGFTRIDIEDRFFDHSWQELKDKPIEKRILKHPDINGIQGYITMWVEVFEKRDRTLVKKWDVSPMPESEVEMRLIIWETEEIEMMDVEGTSDIYVCAFVDADKKQSTDVHYRCQTGAGSFNWRMLMPIKLPRVNNQLHIQVYDNDIFCRDDYICGTTIDIGRFIRETFQLDVPIKFNKDYWDSLTTEEKKRLDIEFVSLKEDSDGIKFWLPMYKNNVKSGRVMCSMEFLPHWKSQICKVGQGRDEPNVNPYLPPPFGRFEWSMNPIKLLNQCVGPRYRRKIYCAICALLVALYLVFVVPYIILHLSGEALNPFNYVSKRD